MLRAVSLSVVRRIVPALVVLCVFTANAVSQQVPTDSDFSDRILKFHSVINIQENGHINVTEHIKVFNGDGDIQRGIVRDFPTRYSDSSGFWSETGFKVKKVLKNGSKEKYIKENLDNGVRLLIGQEDVLLPTGIIEYEIEYETRRQLIFHTDKDEFYWNVNGNGWVFTADSVSAHITFPEGSEIKEYACYTGLQGSTDQDCNIKLHDNNAISFSTSRKLAAYEGLTVAASIQKGILQPPGKWQNAIDFLSANYILPLLVFLLLFQVVYNGYVWHKKGRDPKKGVIFPQFSPPEGITPADAGFIVDQKFSGNLFASALIDCAVRKKLIIEVEREGFIFKTNVYHFKAPEQTITDNHTEDNYGFALSSLYGLKAEKGKYNSALRSLYTSLEHALADRYQIRYRKRNKKTGLFVLNKGYVFFGFLIVAAAIFFSIQFFTTHPSFIVAAICVSTIIVMIIIHFSFRSVMSAYTKEGRKIVDHLLGFRMYLAQAEKHVYNQLAPPEKTLDLFERYLPFAIALEVENEWSEKFSGIIQKALEGGYRPGYYHVSGNRMSYFSAREISRSISSGLSSTVSSASTPPSSSRGGSSGRGSSGGGGGGGGGGGW